jgi:SAM-dependent methyltransferase
MSYTVSLLKNTKIRKWYVKLRYQILKRKMKFKENGSSNIGENTISHNLGAFDQSGGYGCGQRMGLLLYPVIAFDSFNTIDKTKRKVLLVGCRTEDDIFWMRAYGYKKAIGFDLFSYSKNILVGDIHNTEFEDQSFDVVILGWMISYTKDPEAVFKECRRILKVNGLFGIGLEHNPNQIDENLPSPRMNPLNTTKGIKNLLDATMNHSVLFEYDHENDAVGDFSTAVVTIVR